MYVADKYMLLGTGNLKCKTVPDYFIRQTKAQYFVIGDVQKKLSPEPLDKYSLVVKWTMVKLMLIMPCILYL